jgi:hypothetical protein
MWYAWPFEKVRFRLAVAMHCTGCSDGIRSEAMKGVITG